GSVGDSHSAPQTESTAWTHEESHASQACPHTVVTSLTHAASHTPLLHFLPHTVSIASTHVWSHAAPQLTPHAPFTALTQVDVQEGAQVLPPHAAVVATAFLQLLLQLGEHVLP